ncbi:MAG: hypothetical protein CL959_01900 [Euryarchaeota archaeon]|nr:hypothetical protein [Euryarchaeota archaeon]|tara:strand:+ start:1885 stop:2766 length:882 start_codon:yes stop_codon:yes gene_type:complete
MAYTKTHQSTIQVSTTASSEELSGYNQAFREILSTWLPTRGWAVTEHSNNSDSGINNHFHCSKDIQCVGGTTQTLSFGLHIHNDQSHVDWTWYNGSNNMYSDVGGVAFPAGNFFLSENSIYIDGVFEMWSHDTDPDSFVLIVRGNTNFRLLGFMPPAGSLFRADLETNDTYAPWSMCMLPLFKDNPAFANATPLATTAWVGDFQDLRRTSDSLPFVIHNYGVLGMTDGDAQFALINDPDVSTLLAQDKAHAQLQGRADQVHSVQIGANYYIALGLPSTRARLLLNTGTVNLED